MDQLEIARRALQQEISALSAEIARLEDVLAALGGSDSIAPYAKRAGGSAAASSSSDAEEAPRRRGRPKGSGNAAKASSAASGGDVDSALELIEQAGRKGIKALALAAAIKKAGGNRPSKEDLLASGKVKQAGRGGGTTYTYVG